MTSRGDVQLYVARACFLARGHDVQPPGRCSSRISSNVTISPMSHCPTVSYTARCSGAHSRHGGCRGFSGGLKLLKHARPLMMSLLNQELQAAQSLRPDIIIYHPEALVSPYRPKRSGSRMYLHLQYQDRGRQEPFRARSFRFSSPGPFSRLRHVFALKAVDFLFNRDL